MALNDIWSISTRFSANANVWQWTLNYRQTNDIADDPLDAKGISYDYLAAVLTHVLPCLASDCWVESVYVRRRSPAGAPTFRNHMMNTKGTWPSGNSMPPNNCTVFRLSAADDLLERAGRIFMSGLPMDGYTSGQMNGIWDAAARNLADEMQKGIAPGTGPVALELGVWRTTDTIPNPDPEQPPLPGPNSDIFIATDFVGSSPVIYTQKRRTSLKDGFQPLI